ncbi:JHD1 [Candida theae]|uniref:JmjC domain-containing histone demethylation protein 1 n=1 Tax=Candida theae TaxID=1198502 RepID=A0AAD5BCP5_9ASCO|nr:JHD1 [Candida theae]KAI5955540.1 JHD1 [Candida theae]
MLDDCPICSGRGNHAMWIQCSGCHQWFHSKCLQLADHDLSEIVSYHCNKCTPKYGPSEYKRKSKRARITIDYVALNEGDAFALDKGSHFHLPKFLQFTGEEGICIQENLINVTKPTLVPRVNCELVGMKLPRPRKEITMEYIADCCGQDRPVEVMDVISQQGISPGWRLHQWRDYFNTEEQHRDRLRNVISLEISDAPELGTEFHRPQLVREMDLVDKVWNDEDQERSKVTKYCLMSVKDSFTDFHIDFGGTSVYYTVIKGSKSFLMFPPTEDNLDIYTSWCLQPDQNFLWYPEHFILRNKKKIYPNGGLKVTLQPGDLFMIPSGWIHCVHTPQDSIVIGGNYLTLRDMSMQLKIYDIERVTKVPTKFRFPMFNKVIWLSAIYYANHRDEFIKDIGKGEEEEEEEEDGSGILDAMIGHLERHLELSKTNLVARKSIPKSINPREFLQVLKLWRDD